MSGNYPMPLCAICGDRTATCMTDWDDRMVHACAPCVQAVEVPDDEPTFEPVEGVYGQRRTGRHGTGPRRAKVVQVVRRLGAPTQAEIAAAFGVHGSKGSKEYATLTQTVSRLVRAGALIPEGNRCGARTYRVAAAP